MNLERIFAMRRSTLIYSLIGIALYLFATVKYGVERTIASSNHIPEPTPTSAWINRQIKMAEPDHQKIIDLLTEPTTYQSLKPEQRVRLAREYFLIERPDSAISILVPLCQPDQVNWEAAQLLSDHYHFTKQYQLEYDLLTSLPNIKEITPLFERSVFLTAVYDPTALYAMIETIESDPSKPLDQIILASMIEDRQIRDLTIGAQLLRADEIDLAEMVLTADDEGHPPSYQAQPLLAYIFALQGQTERTLEILTQIKDDPDQTTDPTKAIFIASAYQLAGDTEEALAILQPIWETDRQNVNIALPFAKLLEREQPLRALEIYVSLITDDHSEKPLSAILALTIDHPAYVNPYGMDAFQRLSRISDRSITTNITMARFSLARDDPQSVIALLESDRTPQAIWLIANANLLIGDRNAAAIDLIELMEQYPPSAFASLAARSYNNEQLGTIK